MMDIFNDLDGTRNPIFKVAAFLKLNISKTVRLTDKVVIGMYPHWSTMGCEVQEH